MGEGVRWGRDGSEGREASTEASLMWTEVDESEETDLESDGTLAVGFAGVGLLLTVTFAYKKFQFLALNLR